MTQRPLPAKPLPRWLAPKTLPGTILFAAVGYAVWQPLAQLLIHLVWGDPWPFTTRTEWVRFTLVAAAIGMVAGAAMFAVQRMRRGWWREFADNTLRMVAFTMVLRAADFDPASPRWWIVLLLTSVMMGALFGTITHAIRTSFPFPETAAPPLDGEAGPRVIERPAPPPPERRSAARVEHSAPSAEHTRRV